MIANVSPAQRHSDETYNTLKYANRAKNIKTKAVQNSIDVESHLAQYPKIIAALRAEVTKLRSSAPNDDDEGSFEVIMKRIQSIHLKLMDRELDLSTVRFQLLQNQTRVALLDSITSCVSDSTASDNILQNLTRVLDQLDAFNVLLINNSASWERAISRYRDQLNILEDSVTSPILKTRLALALSFLSTQRLTLLLEHEQTQQQYFTKEYNKQMLLQFNAVGDGSTGLNFVSNLLQSWFPMDAEDGAIISAYDSCTDDESIDMSSVCESDAEDTMIEGLRELQESFDPKRIKKAILSPLSCITNNLDTPSTLLIPDVLTPNQAQKKIESPKSQVFRQELDNIIKATTPNGKNKSNVLLRVKTAVAFLPEQLIPVDGTTPKNVSFGPPVRIF